LPVTRVDVLRLGPVAAVAAACSLGPAEPAPPPATAPAPVPPAAPAPAPEKAPPVFAADSSVSPIGRFSLDRVESSTTRHGTEQEGFTEYRIAIEIELGDDGSARVCLTSKSSWGTRVSKYASKSREHENTEDGSASRVGRSGRFVRDGADVVLSLTREEPDCDRGRGLDVNHGAVRCTPGKLDGRDVLACAPEPALGGDHAALPFARPAPMVLLGRPRLVAALIAKRTTRDPPGSKPDPGDPAAWSLAW
jgi:hypothetical protein